MFYIGEVENNGYDGSSPIPDPEGRNRVQIRIFGFHSSSNTQLPTKCLPWAEYSAPLVGGFGIDSSGLSFIPELKTHVYCFFMYDNPNKPVIIGSVQGKGNTSRDASEIKFVSRSGHTITIDDSDSAPYVSIKSKSGQELKFDDTSGSEKMIIRKSGDHAVRYKQLETAFNQLKTEFGNLVTMYNTHIHVVSGTAVPGPTPPAFIVTGSATPTPNQGSPSSADITSAKITEIEVPGIV